MQKSLDLCFNGKIDSEISEMFNSLSYGLRSEFNKIITIITKPHKADLDWWIEGPAGRNPSSSPFFHYFCCIYFIKSLVDHNNFSFDRVLVDNAELKRIIESMLNDLGVISCMVVHIKPSIRRIFKNRLMLSMLICKKIVQLVIARGSGKINLQSLSDKKLILIDTYMIAEYTNNDRWYGSLWENMSDELKNQTYFVPTIVMTPIRKMGQTYKELRSNKRNFLIKEDFITFSDIIFAALHQQRVKKIKIEPVSILNYEVSNMIKDELLNNRDKLSVIDSLLTYRFVKKIKKKGLQVHLAIDWFEGQPNDKAWSYSFNLHYTKAKTIGYRAFESYPFYLCSYPIPVENEANILPKVMAVQGKATVKTVKEFMPNLDVIVIPSFKSQHVWGYDYKISGDNITIIVTLPISIRTSIKIIEKLLKVNSSMSLSDKKIKYIIKPHPTHSSDRIKVKVEDIAPDNFMVTEEKSLTVLLRKADILVSEASSTCLEALACGKPVIIVENEEGLTYDPVPAIVPLEIVRRTRSDKQLTDVINHFINMDVSQKKQLISIGQKIRANFFEPISKDGINRFFHIESNKGVKGA